MEDPAAAGVAGAVQLFPEQEQQQQLRCPRCDSTDTKFCYYNNYNMSQPRHFCKSCRRYWTRGGALRNVPVGGAPRKPKSRPSPYSRPAADAFISSSALEAGPPLASLPPPHDGDRRVLDVLASDRQFENLLEGSGAVTLPSSLQSSKESSGNDAGASPTEDLLGMLGDSSCWANWWPDLAIE